MGMIKPGHTSLNMDDIAEDLQIVHRHVTKLPPYDPYLKDNNGNPVQIREDGSINKPVLKEHWSKIMKADDVDLVAGIKAEQIAIAISEDNRTTIDNANHLDGHDIDWFMTAEEGHSVADKEKKIVQNFGNDITDLRNELYELKHELEKRGVIRDTWQRMGYNDIFRNGYKPYEYELIGEPAQDCPNRRTIILPADSASKIDVGDFISVYFRDVEKVNVRQVERIEPDGETIILDEALDAQYDIMPTNMQIYKSAGVSKDGNFYFARDVKIAPGDKEIYTGLDDDTSYKFRRPVKDEDSSYAYSFRIPEYKLGFLTEFSIMARAIGNPTLTCYIIDEADRNYFKNPQQAQKLYETGELDADGEPKMHFFAKSAPLQLDPTLGQTVYNFNFWNTDLEKYPLVSRKDSPTYRVRYLAIVCGTYIDKNNYADIYFLQNKKTDGSMGDLELNNTVYYYTEQVDDSLDKAFSTDEKLNASDMFYGVILREPVVNDLEPYPRGLYSAKIRCSYPEGISRARLMMRFAREGGLWEAKLDEEGVYGAGTNQANFEIVNKKMMPHQQTPLLSAVTLSLANKIRKPMELRTDAADVWQTPQLVVGNNLVEGTASGAVATPMQPTLVSPEDMVYRNAFIISVKGKRWEYDAALQKYTIRDKAKIYLHPVAVIRDGVKYNKDVYSDRVIWEGDFTDDQGNAKFFNELEIQVYWENTGLSDSVAIRKMQMGIIHDFVFSTDKAV